MHPELAAVARDISDEQPVTWFSAVERGQLAFGGDAGFLQQYE